MSIINFIASNPDLTSFEDENYSQFQKVVSTALNHTSRDGLDELYETARPNEEKVFTDWRQSNRRHITIAPIYDFKRMLIRVLQSSLQEIESDDFPNIKDYAYGLLMDLSIVDPNAKVIEWPIIPENENTAPATPAEITGVGQNRKLDAITHIITSNRIKYYDKQMFIWDSGGTLNVGTEKVPNEQPVFYAIDKQYYYVLTPRKVKDKITYDPNIWYFHDFGYLPIAELPGYNTFNQNDGIISLNSYKESICFAAFEYLNEAVIAISSDQINRIRNVNPKLVINANVLCPKCNGKGKTMLRNEEHECKNCSGVGSLQNIGDFATVKLNPKTDFDNANTNPIYYVSNPGNLEYSFTVWEKLIEKAEKALCTDLLEGNDSGISKEYRLEPKQDLLKTYGEQYCNMLTMMINNKAKIKNINAEKVTINTPNYYHTKSPSVLRVELQSSMPGERYGIYMNMIKTKYRGNDFMINVHYNAVLYAPLLVYKHEEIDSVIALGSYTEKDIKRRDYAVYAIETVLEKEPDLKGRALFEKADTLLIEMGFMMEVMETMDGDFDSIESVDDLPDDLDELEEVLTKLLNNEISRQDALRLVQIIEGIDEIEAEELLTETGL